MDLAAGRDVERDAATATLELVPEAGDALRVRYSVTARAMAIAERAGGGPGVMAVRVVFVRPDPLHVVRAETRTVEVGTSTGACVVVGPRGTARAVGAIGLLCDGRFVAIAHGPVVHAGDRAPVPAPPAAR